MKDDEDSTGGMTLCTTGLLILFMLLLLLLVLVVVVVIVLSSLPSFLLASFAAWLCIRFLNFDQNWPRGGERALLVPWEELSSSVKIEEPSEKADLRGGRIGRTSGAMVRGTVRWPEPVAMAACRSAFATAMGLLLERIPGPFGGMSPAIVRVGGLTNETCVRDRYTKKQKTSRKGCAAVI